MISNVRDLRTWTETAVSTSSVVVLGRTNQAVGRLLSRSSWGFTRWPLLASLAAHLAAVVVAASSSPVLSCSQHLCQSAACGLTRRCSGPAVLAGFTLLSRFQPVVGLAGR